MRTYLECVVCFLRQALEAARMVSGDPALHERVVREVMRRALEVSFAQPPPVMGREIHRIVRAEGGCSDPYAEVKRRYNAFAVRLLPGLRRRVEDAADPFEAAVRLAVAGNVIDFGLTNRLDEEGVQRTVEESLQTPLAVDHVAQLREMVGEANLILYLTDNAGEIAFDRLLIERLPAGRTVVAVRGSPIINDATLQDARAVGLVDLVEVVDNGSDAPGTVLSLCSPEFLRVFEAADLVIAKGQGNYETLNEVEKRICFLLKAKCEVVARDIGCGLGGLCVLCRLPRG